MNEPIINPLCGRCDEFEGCNGICSGTTGQFKPSGLCHLFTPAKDRPGMADLFGEDVFQEISHGSIPPGAAEFPPGQVSPRLAGNLVQPPARRPRGRPRSDSLQHDFQEAQA